MNRWLRAAKRMRVFYNTVISIVDEHLRMISEASHYEVDSLERSLDDFLVRILGKNEIDYSRDDCRWVRIDFSKPMELLHALVWRVFDEWIFEAFWKYYASWFDASFMSVSLFNMIVSADVYGADCCRSSIPSGKLHFTKIMVQNGFNVNIYCKEHSCRMPLFTCIGYSMDYAFMLPLIHLRMHLVCADKYLDPEHEYRDEIMEVLTKMKMWEAIPLLLAVMHYTGKNTECPFYDMPLHVLQLILTH
jgi:hypothetical protein